ncbi:hypothetical protein CR5_019 [Cronobacter phage CR5]|uniref:hypothetical protein n=1 Tax=Cronobacter phage CR5 TaxID=1195085 RepID=UPI0003427179|nr:hypothetical protein CR5_019 [Cronobacter phage CR5]AFO71239.1 hypothetical protein CR5_019 [Cronobacter phage CR5]
MKFKDIIDFLTLDTFSGTVVDIGTTTYPIKNEGDAEVVSLDITIESEGDPERKFVYHMGPIEFMGVIKDHKLAVGDFISVRKYPLQKHYGVRKHRNLQYPAPLERAAARYMLTAGVKVLSLQARERREYHGSDDLTAQHLDNHALRAILIRQRLEK